MIGDLSVSVGLDKAEWLEDIEGGESSLAYFLACIDSVLACRKFEEGLDNVVKVAIYKMFGKRVKFKKYLHAVCDVGTRLLFGNAWFE